MTQQQWIVGLIFISLGVVVVLFDLWRAWPRRGISVKEMQTALAELNADLASLAKTSAEAAQSASDAKIGSLSMTAGTPPLDVVEKKAEESAAAAESAKEKSAAVQTALKGGLFDKIAESHPLAILGVVLMVAGAAAMGVRIDLSIGAPTST